MPSANADKVTEIFLSFIRNIDFFIPNSYVKLVEFDLTYVLHISNSDSKTTVDFLHSGMTW